jgi:isoleucyl-tRNA synthetase
MPQAAAAIAALDPGGVAEAIKGERKIGVHVEGTDHDLEPGDISLVMEPLEGFAVEAEAGRAVALATELSDELVAEGTAREVVRAVQNARKEAGLDVTDRITLALGGDESVIDAARANEAYVAGETLADRVAYDAGSGAAAQTVVLDGRELLISVERA